VSAQQVWFANVTQVSVPELVVASQPAPVTVTASFSINVDGGQSVVISIVDQSTGKLLPTTAPPTNSCYAETSMSMCTVPTTANSGGCIVPSCGSYTTTFALTAPNQADIGGQTWNLIVTASVVVLNPSLTSGYSVVNFNSKTVLIVVTSSSAVSEFSIAELPMILVCVGLVLVSFRKSKKNQSVSNLPNEK
jgi:hypothetical protein